MEHERDEMKEEESQEPELRSLSGLSAVPGSRPVRRRLGRGNGSGSGTTCGKGAKGQSSRSGYSLPRGFEGGQMPLHRRLPMVGFTSRKTVRGSNVFSVVDLGRLAEIDGEEVISLDVMRSRGLVRSRQARVKVLGNGELQKKLVVEAHAISAGARAAIEKAGGEVRLLAR